MSCAWCGGVITYQRLRCRLFRCHWLGWGFRFLRSKSPKTLTDLDDFWHDCRGDPYRFFTNRDFWIFVPNSRNRPLCVKTSEFYISETGRCTNAKISSTTTVGGPRIAHSKFWPQPLRISRNWATKILGWVPPAAPKRGILGVARGTTRGVC